jgi:hypothetical protein
VALPVAWRIAVVTIEGASFITRFAAEPQPVDVSGDLLFLGRKVALLGGCMSRDQVLTWCVRAIFLGVLGEGGTRCRLTPNRPARLPSDKHLVPLLRRTGQLDKPVSVVRRLMAAQASMRGARRDPSAGPGTDGPSVPFRVMQIFPRLL